jgi:hypothetical protein
MKKLWQVALTFVVVLAFFVPMLLNSHKATSESGNEETCATFNQKSTSSQEEQLDRLAGVGAKFGVNEEKLRREIKQVCGGEGWSTATVTHVGEQLIDAQRSRP